MNAPSRSSSGRRPFQPTALVGTLNHGGGVGGPIRLPSETPAQFIAEFNAIYGNRNLRISAPPSVGNDQHFSAAEPRPDE